MFERPQLANYASYQHYALAAIGYAYVSQSASCGDSNSRACIDHSFDRIGTSVSLRRIGAIEDGSGPDDSAGNISNDDQSCKQLMVIGGRIVGGLDSDGDKPSCCHCQGVQDSAQVSDGLRGVGVNSSVVVDDANGIVSQLSMVDTRSQRVVNSGKSDSLVIPNDCSDSPLLSMRGANWDRNQKWKVRRKMRKDKKQRMQSNWRETRSVGGSSSDVVNDSHVKGKDVDQIVNSGRSFEKPVVGFFSECDNDTRKKLRESRAAALVAKNNLEAARARQQLSDIDNCTPQMALAKELIRVTDMANKLKRNTKDAEIGGWAKTVADGLTKSVAESAPSSIPSLESVGFGKSGLKSSDGSFVDADRLRAYNKEIADIERSFDIIGIYSDDEYNEAIISVKEKYADIAYSSEDLFKRKYNEELIPKLLAMGLSPAAVDDALGIDYEAAGPARYSAGNVPDNDAVSCLLRAKSAAKVGKPAPDSEAHWDACRKAAYDNGFDRNHVGKAFSK